MFGFIDERIGLILPDRNRTFCMNRSAFCVHTMRICFETYWPLNCRKCILVILKKDRPDSFEKSATTGGPQIVLFLRSQGTILLRKPYYLGTDLVLKSRFMTFGFLLIFKLF